MDVKIVEGIVLSKFFTNHSATVYAYVKESGKIRLHTKQHSLAAKITIGFLGQFTLFLPKQSKSGEWWIDSYTPLFISWNFYTYNLSFIHLVVTLLMTETRLGQPSHDAYEHVYQGFLFLAKLDSRSKCLGKLMFLLELCKHVDVSSKSDELLLREESIKKDLHLTEIKFYEVDHQPDFCHTGECFSGYKKIYEYIHPLLACYLNRLAPGCGVQLMNNDW